MASCTYELIIHEKQVITRQTTTGNTGHSELKYGGLWWVPIVNPKLILVGNYTMYIWN